MRKRLPRVATDIDERATKRISLSAGSFGAKCHCRLKSSEKVSANRPTERPTVTVSYWVASKRLERVVTHRYVAENYCLSWKVNYQYLHIYPLRRFIYRTAQHYCNVLLVQWMSPDIWAGMSSPKSAPVSGPISRRRIPVTGYGSIIQPRSR